MTAVRFALVLCALSASCATGAEMAVWIDTDPAIGPPWREVDDAFALILAFRSPEIRLVGVSATYGNADLRRTTSVARDLVRRFGGSAGIAEREVYAGATSPRDRLTRTEATEALARALRKERLTYIALGPLTNLAALLELHPELAQRIERVIVLGGRSPDARFAFGPKKRFPVHDANMFKDPAAAVAVLRARRPIVLVPIEITPQLALTPTDMRLIERSGEAGEFLFRRSRAWLWFWTHFVGEKGGLVFDVAAILPALQPSRLETETRFAQFDQNGDLVAHRSRRRGAWRVQFATGVRAGTKEFVVKRLGTRASLPERRRFSRVGP